MRSILFLLGAAWLLLAACTDELQHSDNQTCGGGRTPLQISVNESFITKVTGQTTGTSLASGAEIGVFVTTPEGASYDAKDYDNIKYTATGEGVGQTWAFDVNTPVMLSSTKGKVYGYYPRQESGVSLNSITISNDGNDWMYTPTASSEVSILNPTAELNMKHAMTIIRVKVVAGNTESDGTISSLTLDGSGWATSATLDLQNGTIGSYVGEGASLVANDLGALNTTGVNQDFWVVSNKTASAIAFKVNVGSDVFVVNTPAEVTLDRGKVYNYTLNVESKKGAELSSVTLTDWTLEENVGLDAEYSPWIGLEDGVYAIDGNGYPVDYATASAAATGTYKGVVLVMNGKAIEIAMEDASVSSKWTETYPMSDEEAAFFSSNYITMADATNIDGFLKKPDGSYNSDSKQLSDDISTWTEGSLADVDGKTNTNRILAANVTIASVIRSFNNGSHENTDWYLPTEGQLAYMFMNYEKINNLLTKVSGTSISTSDRFWSSSLCSAYGAWYVGFSNGSVSYSYVTDMFRVRLVRDI